MKKTGFGKVWDSIRDTMDEHKQLEDQRYMEANHNKSLKDMFSENAGGDAIQREYNESQGTVEYQAIANRKKDDMQVSSHQTLTKKARAMKYTSYCFKPFSFYGSFYSMQTEISESFSIGADDFATLFIAISLALLIEVLLHFEATSIFNQREKGVTRMVGVIFFTMLISINLYMHWNTTLIMRKKYASTHEANVVQDLTSPEAMFVKKKIAKLESQIVDERSSMKEIGQNNAEQRKLLQAQRKTYTTSKEYLLSKHESKRARARIAIADIDKQLATLGVTSFRLDNLEEELEAQQVKLMNLSNNKLGEIEASGDRAMYVALVLLLIVELGSRLDLYFYFITRFNLTQSVLAMSKKAFDGLSILEQVQDIFAQFEGRLRVVANQQQQLATSLINGQEKQLDYQLLQVASQTQESNRTREILLTKLDEGYGHKGTAYDYDTNGKTEQKNETLLRYEMDELQRLLKEHLDSSFIVVHDSEVKGAKLEGKCISIQTDLILDEKKNKLLHEIAHIKSGSSNHDENFKAKAKEMGVKRTSPKKTEGIITTSRVYDIYMEMMLVQLKEKVNVSISEAERAELIRLGIIDESNTLLVPSIVAFERMSDG